jgi:hypothetical protein
MEITGSGRIPSTEGKKAMEIFFHSHSFLENRNNFTREISHFMSTFVLMTEFSALYNGIFTAVSGANNASVDRIEENLFSHILKILFLSLSTR